MRAKAIVSTDRITRKRWFRMNRKEWARIAAAVGYVLPVTYMSGNWAVRQAYLERGYEGIGGEYLFIPMAAWGAYKLIDGFLDALEEMDYAETGSGGSAGV